MYKGVWSRSSSEGSIPSLKRVSMSHERSRGWRTHLKKTRNEVFREARFRVLFLSEVLHDMCELLPVIECLLDIACQSQSCNAYGTAPSGLPTWNSI